MVDDLQDIVDDLAERLRRSVAIDDPRLRLLAASRHFDDEDATRVASVLNRSIDPRLCEEILAQGIARWTAPGRVVVPLAGASRRICVPIRCNGLLLGYLWLIDSGPTRPQHEDVAREAAERAGAVLYRALLVHERARARHEAILWELVATDHAVRSQAVDDLRAEQLFPDTALCLQVLGIQHQNPDRLAAPQAVALEAAVEDTQSWMSHGQGGAVVRGHALMAADKSRMWLLLAVPEPLSHRELDAVHARLTTRFEQLLRRGGQIVLGIGGVVHRIEDVIDSYREAFLAVRAAQLVPSIGPLARWGELGPYELLLKMPADDLFAAAQVPALVALHRADGNRGLVATLETFLDSAGDAARTARRLEVHRATLYHRLKRIEQLTGCELSRGEDRLTLHLGLKLQALAAAYRNETASLAVEEKPAPMRSVS
ncbi:helix-turn-helix domain-containing protein [Amycolatopsis endophytica]|uniref:Sugar diacid utilization regulator n=1 Tax=Amycolatopsis endophytica TaxID=860233 RepID=A0A853BBI6_9PSEU|nr:helix-turn-helix domain-containing protein [Amycolatopsis endophytica]NYI92145.1 sugar diacid utilization regulator [Amycolatopsis endophytica]